jgi:hypothetical protein
MENMSNNLISIVTQAFYGNRTGTEIKAENVDRFILGSLDDFPIDYPIDRTVVKLPNMDNIVLIYNKYKEEERRELKERVLKEENYVLKPLAVIPEENIEIYSRCIVCRMSENGELESLREGDYEKFVKYLAE